MYVRAIGLCALFAAVSFSATGLHADYYDGLRDYENKNYASAFKHWQVEADRGDAKSQYRLGYLLEKGLGTKKDRAKAHLYYSMAAAQGFAEAKSAAEALLKKLQNESKFHLSPASPEKSAPPRRLPQGLAETKTATVNRESVPTASSMVRPSAKQLIGAITKGKIKRAKRLIQTPGLDVNGSSFSGWTPLMMASRRKDVELVVALLGAGARVNQANDSGFTPLHIAVASINPNVVAHLVKAGSNLKAKTRSGRSPMGLLFHLDPGESLSDASRIARFLCKGEHVVDGKVRCAESRYDAELKAFYVQLATMLYQKGYFSIKISSSSDLYSGVYAGESLRKAINKFHKDKFKTNRTLTDLEKDYLVREKLRQKFDPSKPIAGLNKKRKRRLVTRQQQQHNAGRPKAPAGTRAKAKDWRCDTDLWNARSGNFKPSHCD